MNMAKTFSINRNEENEQIHSIERETFPSFRKLRVLRVQ